MNDTHSPSTYSHLTVMVAVMPARKDLAARRRAAFGARLRALRHERGWSQEQLAHAAGLDRTYIGSVERGERNIALDNIWLIADTLKVTPADLIN
jgi:DNA-binding XRE family transcriptional regulator